MILHLVTSDPADAPSRFVPAGYEWPPPRKDAPALRLWPPIDGEYPVRRVGDRNPLADRMRAYYGIGADQ